MVDYDPIVIMENHDSIISNHGKTVEKQLMNAQKWFQRLPKA